MHTTSARSAHGPDRARTGYRRRRGIPALLVALACLAGFALAELATSPSEPATSPPGTAAPAAGTAAPRQEGLAAVSWPADGVSAADINGQGRDFYSNTSYEGIDRNKIDGLASVTGRIGWNGWDPTVLFYIKGGWAWAHERDIIQTYYYSTFGPLTSSRSGWTIGGGVEWAFSFAPRWSAFVEYDHYGFGHRDLIYTSGYATSIKLNIDVVKIGVNYKLFGGFGP